MLRLSKSTFQELKRKEAGKVEVEELRHDFALRKRFVDSAFARVVEKHLRTALDLEASYDRHLDLVEKAKQSTRQKIKGSVVVLLGTGQCGVVTEDEKTGKGGRRVLVQLDGGEEEEEIKVPNSDLFWMKHCSGEEDAVRQIWQKAGVVPTMDDIKLGSRVCVPHLKHQTGRVESLPKPKSKQTCFGVRMDVTRNLIKCVAERLRLVVPNCEELGPPFGKVGRPSKEESAEFARTRQVPLFLIPESKATKAWREALQPPRTLPPPRSNDEDEGEDEEEEDEEEEAAEYEV
ncbi:hypothetical protein BASA81_002078 [Batrachochytrium salamandrivorans]|nr:hypothetical protein BASA81_002078 [Batrachochytrium salamandrivorans]